jgi:hypothetical protein
MWEEIASRHSSFREAGKACPWLEQGVRPGTQEHCGLLKYSLAVLIGSGLTGGTRASE